MMLHVIPHWTYRCAEHLALGSDLSAKTLTYEHMFTLFHVKTNEYIVVLLAWVAYLLITSYTTIQIYIGPYIAKFAKHSCLFVNVGHQLNISGYLRVLPSPYTLGKNIFDAKGVLNKSVR